VLTKWTLQTDLGETLTDLFQGWSLERGRKILDGSSLVLRSKKKTLSANKGELHVGILFAR
jgi:hypothetical protein